MDPSARWISTVVLGDGTSAVIRPITPDDAEGLADFHLRQSLESRYLRYFSPKPELTDADLERFTNVDFVDRAAFVVEEHGEFVAWASYERWNNRDDAEVAFHVDDRHHGLGIATLLLEHLAAVARSNGIERFTAQTLGDNRSMLAVFTKAGWPVHRRFDSGVIDVEFPLADTAAFLDSVERREQRADSRAMARMLLPTSIAVIGASDRPATVGNALWRNAASDRRRRVYPVNPNRSEVGGVRSYASIIEIPDEVALALIAVPIAALERTLQECIDKRVRGAVVVTTTHRPVDPTPDDVDVDVVELVAHARSNGLRIIGPGSMGVASPRDDIALQAALVKVDLPPGNVAMSIQSGTLGSALLRRAAQLQLPTSWFVSLGEKADVSGNDLLQFWEDDEATNVIGLYTESFGNPRKFARLARRVSRTRPIVAVRTGAALIGPATDALYRDTGVIEVPTVPALLDTVRVLATQPLMAGRRVAVLTNSQSPGVLAAATLQAAGLEVVDPPRQLDWRSTPEDYATALAAACASDDLDAIMVIHAPPVIDAIGAPTDAIESACVGSTKTVVAVMLGSGDGPLSQGSPIPSFSFPEQATGVLGRIAAHAEWRQTELATCEDETISDHIDVSGVGRSIAEHVGDEHLAPETIAAILDGYGVSMADARLVAAERAVETAEHVGYPVAVKAEHRRIGRSVEAGVALDLADADDVAAAVDTMRTHLGADADRVIVQQMVTPGADVRVRVRTDDRFGPVISFGLGGLQADAIGDETRRLAPVSTAVAAAMIAETRAATAIPDDSRDQLADLVARVAQLASDHPTIVALDLNPVVVSESGCVVVDAELVLAARERPEPAVRRLE